jgi:hypothetical protein
MSIFAVKARKRVARLLEKTSKKKAAGTISRRL